MDNQYELLVKFPDGSNSFVNGFESGEIWGAMQSGNSLERAVHEENKGVITSMAEALNYHIEFGDTEVEGWLHLVGYKKNAPTKLNKNGLFIVK